MNKRPTPPPVDDHVFLLGRPPVSEFLNFIFTMALDGQNTNQGELAAQWRTANDLVKEIERTESGSADNPSVAQLPPGLEALGKQVLDHPFFRRAFNAAPTELALVELDRLVVYQKYINLGFVAGVKASLGESPTPEAVFRLAFSMDGALPSVSWSRTAANTYSFISPSNDFRFLDAAFLNVDQVHGYEASGPMIGTVGIVMGFGSNFLNAIDLEGRLVLNNGSHRAYALRDLGLTHAPCLVQHLSRRDELEIVGQQELRLNADRYLKAPRPPLLKDYFDPRLRMVVGVPRKNTLVRVQFGVEVTAIPAA